MTHFLTFLSLVLLVFLNMMLFYKLWMLEYSAQSLTTWQGLRLHERCMHTRARAHTLFLLSKSKIEIVMWLFSPKATTE